VSHTRPLGELNEQPVAALFTSTKSEKMVPEEFDVELFAVTAVTDALPAWKLTTTRAVIATGYLSLIGALVRARCDLSSISLL